MHQKTLSHFLFYLTKGHELVVVAMWMQFRKEFSCNRFDSYKGWYNGVALLLFPDA